MASKDFTYGFKAKAEKISLAYREKLQLSPFDCLDAFTLANYLKVSIYTFDEVLSAKEHLGQRDLLNTHPSISALHTVNFEGAKVILHKGTVSIERQQSNIMHELAHIILEHKTPIELVHLCNKFSIPYNNDRQENEAKYLGGCLQLTKAILNYASKYNLTAEQISTKYKASVEMVNYRLNVSGVNKIKYYKSNK